jgi:PBP1b-binding outer membrane lipoprotein LpoB
MTRTRITAMTLAACFLAGCSAAAATAESKPPSKEESHQLACWRYIQETIDKKATEDLKRDLAKNELAQAIGVGMLMKLCEEQTELDDSGALKPREKP